MRVGRGVALALGLAVFAIPDAADACSASEPPSAILTAPVFEGDTRIEHAALDVTCDDATCRFEAHYFLSRPGSRGSLALRGGSELRVRESSGHRVGDWLVVEFPADAREISVTGRFSLPFSANPCVGPGYLARHRFLGTEGRALDASFMYVVPDRAVPHVVHLKAPKAPQLDTFDGDLPPLTPEPSLAKRALRETVRVRNAREEGRLAPTHEASFRLLQVWFTRPPFPLQNAGPMLAAGYRFDVKRPWFHLGYEVAVAGWLLPSVGVESDLRDHSFLVPALELTTSFGHGGGDHDTIFGAGAGVPIELEGESRVFGRVFVSASMTSFGLLGGVDYAPKTHDVSGNALAAIWF